MAPRCHVPVHYHGLIVGACAIDYTSHVSYSVLMTLGATPAIAPAPECPLVTSCRRLRTAAGMLPPWYVVSSLPWLPVVDDCH